VDELIQSFFVKSSAISLLKDEITEITGEFEDLTVLKQSLEDEKKELDEQKKGLDDSHDLLIAERNKLQRELNEKYNSRELVSRNIAGLRTKITDLQYHLLLVRQGGTNVDPEAVPSGEDALASIEGFHKYADSGDFGVFAIGAYTHRQGLSQWGAKARAESGQSYKKILSDYYPGSSLGTKSTSGIKIKVKYCDKVNGVTVCNRCVNERIVEYDFETNYMYRLGEMPESWDMEALKAQAIAARTYALNSTNYGEKTIRGDECGQAIAGMKTGRWKEAVDATKGTVMLEDGKVFSSQYAAINGAWVGDAKEKGWWDTTDSSSDWQHKAWDTQSKTGRFGTYYWFYKMWYRTGYAVGSSVSANSCYREPWLSPEELADIVNAAQVLEQTGGDSRIVPIYDACHSAEDYAVSPYSHGELRKIAPKGAKRVNDVITYNSNGRTQNIEFYTDVGEITVSGVSFKLAYNMRAPGHLRIPQGDIRRYDTVYDWVHINIEKN
jgi:hypothetical protein